ncbi:uncharacterized protein LOC144665947 isoform X14 [Oculina patagonica]
MSKRKCFCSDCDGKIRSWNTVKRHRTLYLPEHDLSSTDVDVAGNIVAEEQEVSSIVEEVPGNIVAKEGEVSSLVEEVAGNVVAKEGEVSSIVEEVAGNVVAKEGEVSSIVEEVAGNIVAKEGEVSSVVEEVAGNIVAKEGEVSSVVEEVDGNIVAKDHEVYLSEESGNDDSWDEFQFTGKVVLKDKVEISDDDSTSEICTTDDELPIDCSENQEEEETRHEAFMHQDFHHAVTEVTEKSEDQHQENITIVQWICHLLIKLKLNYNCSNALFSLIITLINFILALIKHPLHLLFPKTLKDLMLISNLKVFNECEVMAVCPNVKCNALYKQSEIVRKCANGDTKPAICKNKLFGKLCRAELAYCENLSFGKKKWVPFKKFPFLAPSKWINLFFKNREFVKLIQQRPDPSGDGQLRDMWDGRVLRIFLKDPKDHNQPLLQHKHNLALLLYLDFFNPFSRAIHSSGVLCMTVLNLPRCVRHQKKWAMLIGIIPGPEEAQRHINSFLKPVVDDLLLLYTGVKVTDVVMPGKTFISRAVLLPVLGDIPASRKLSQFLSHKANKPCDKCHEKAKREPGTAGASGRMSFVTESMPRARTDKEVRAAMDKYQTASSKHASDAIAKVSGVRYSELSRLPYFNTVDNFLVDPMHNVFLGLVEDIGNAIIVQDEKFITSNGRDTFQRRMSSMRLPYDVGRLPHTMLNKSSGRGITAQQWKNFIISFARVCLWGEVSKDAYKMVRTLAEACEIVLRDPLNHSDIEHLKKLLQVHHHLYAKIFGEYSVSVNYHMILHLPDQILNWGPPSAWWCFPYERRIGELSDTLTSGKSVEEQIFNHFFLQHCADHLPMPVLPTSLREQIPSAITPLLETPSVPDSLQETAYLGRAAEDFFTGQVSCYSTMLPPGDPFHLVELEEFPFSTWPVVLLPPQKINQRIQVSFLKDLKMYFEQLYKDAFLLVEPRIDIYARCNVNGTLFSSQFNRTDRGSNVLCYCVDRDLQGAETPAPYFGKVTFFFKASVHLTDSSTGIPKRKTHSLVFLDWYRFANPKHSVDQSSGLHALSGLFYKGDNIVNARRMIRRVVLTEVKRNYNLVANLSK